MRHILDFILDLLIGFWALISGIYRITNREIRRFIAVELIIIGACVTLMMTGWIFKLQLCVVIGSYFAALVFIIFWKFGDEAAQFISAMTSDVPFLKRITVPVSMEMRKLLRPLVFISLTLAFTGSVSSIIGVRYLTIQTVLVWTGIALFFSILSVYIGIATKIPGYAMAIVLVYLLFGRFLMPVPVAGNVNALNAWLTNGSLNKQFSNREAEIVNIRINTPLYNRVHGEFVFANHSGSNIKAKVINQVKDEASGEELYLIVLPNVNHSYIGGTQCYVSVRQAEPLSSKMADKSVPRNSNTGNTIYITSVGAPNFDLEPNRPSDEWIEVGDQLKYSFTSDGGDFKVLYKRGDMINFDRANVKIPDYAGPFKIIGGSQKVKVTLLVNKM